MDKVVVPSPDCPSTAADLASLTKSTFVREVEFHQTIGSTNDRALHHAPDLTVPTPLLVLAQSQTGGRGRGTNQWWASPGALTFSLLLRTEKMRLPQECWPLVSLTAGLAVCEAIEDHLDEQAIELKWPNDVFVRQRKACGILVEVPKQSGTLVIGIGINVNNSMAEAPADLQSSAIALCDAAGKDLSVSDLLTGVLKRLEQRLDWIGRRDDDLRARWRARCLLTGRHIHLDSPTGSVVGVCRGIDDNGALVIETADKTERCYAGTVARF